MTLLRLQMRSRLIVNNDSCEAGCFCLLGDVKPRSYCFMKHPRWPPGSLMRMTLGYPSYSRDTRTGKIFAANEFLLEIPRKLYVPFVPPASNTVGGLK